MIQTILFILLISFGIGLPLTFLIVPKHHTLGRIGLSYLLGIGLFTLLMYGTNVLGLKLTFLNNIFIFLVVSIPLIFIERKSLVNYRKDLKKSAKNFHPDLLEKVILVVIAFLIISSFIATFYWPVYIWDALTMYDFRAHVFAQTGFIVQSLQDIGGGYYLGYPLLTSLSHTVVYLSGGNNPQFIYSLFYLSLGLVFYGQLREFIPRKFSLLFTSMLLSVPQIFNQSVVSYTNLPFMTFFGLGSIYLYIWYKRGMPGYLMLSSILVGLSTWTRATEPFWLGILAVVVLSSVIRKKYLNILFYSIIFFPIQQAWKYILGHIAVWQSSTISEVAGYTTVLPNVLNIERWGQVIDFLYQNIIRNWGAVFIVFIVTFFYSIATKTIKETYMMYTISFIMLIMLVIGNFIFSYTFLAWNAIPDSASRMAMVVYPLFVYSISLTFGDDIDHKPT